MCIRDRLVIELKRGRPSDEVVGQVQRYMGDVMTEVAEPDLSLIHISEPTRPY